MKPVRDPGFHRPFAGLQRLLRERRLPSLAPVAPAPPSPRPVDPSGGEPTEEELFLQAVADTRPIKANRLAAEAPAAPLRSRPRPPLGDETEPLRRLVEHGEGFEVCLTSEYVAGPAGRTASWLTERLHRGAFALQDHLDLHGLTLETARLRFEEFLNRALREGKRAVLIVHGRGLSSPGEPILKTGILRWLESGPWRRWVIAYASARLCDGGGGATAVLLRRTPARRARRRRPSGGDTRA